MNEALENGKTYGFSPVALLHKIIQVVADEIKTGIVTEVDSETLQEKALEYLFDTNNKNHVARIDFNGTLLQYNYRQLSEAVLAIYLAFAINKSLQIKSHIMLGDSPDIVFVDTASPTSKLKVEVYESYEHNRDNSVRIPIDEVAEVEKLWKCKGLNNYGENTDLLITMPKKGTIDLGKFMKEISKKEWFFQRIFLHTYNAEEDRHYYHLFEVKNPTKVGRIDFAHRTDSEYYY